MKPRSASRRTDRCNHPCTRLLPISEGPGIVSDTWLAKHALSCVPKRNGQGHVATKGYVMSWQWAVGKGGEVTIRFAGREGGVPERSK